MDETQDVWKVDPHKTKLTKDDPEKTVTKPREDKQRCLLKKKQKATEKQGLQRKLARCSRM